MEGQPISEEELKNMSPEQIAELQKQNCIFCKIIKGEIPSKKVYEDEHSVCILDINPASEGHVLVLPKEHYQIMPQMPENLIKHLFIVAKEISQAILKAFGAKGTNVFAANGPVAGQKAPHFMIHVFQRSESDGIFANTPLTLRAEDVAALNNHVRGKIYAAFGEEAPEEEQEESLLDEESVDSGLVRALSGEKDEPQQQAEEEDEEDGEEDEEDDGEDDEKPSAHRHEDNLESEDADDVSFEIEHDPDKPDLDKISELFR